MVLRARVRAGARPHELEFIARVALRFRAGVRAIARVALRVRARLRARGGSHGSPRLIARPW